MSSSRGTKVRASSASSGPSTDESRLSGRRAEEFEPRQRPSSSQLFDGPHDFHASTPVLASGDTRDTPRIRKSQRIGSLRRRTVRTDSSSQARTAAERGAATATATAAQHLLSAASRVVLIAGWIPLKSVKQLQLTSLSACRDCREATGFHVRVVARTPWRLWTDPRSRRSRSSRGSGGRRRTRGGEGEGAASVPPLRADNLTFGEHYERPPLKHVALPPSLKRITFGARFNKSVSGVHLPETLAHIRFGCRFNQPVAGVAFPANLRTVEFGCAFNQTLRGVSWNAGLRHIYLGSDFNQPLRGVVWPRGMVFLDLGGAFDQPVEGEGVASWPEGLECLWFSNAFNQPVSGLAFPPALRVLRFGPGFDQPVADVGWPQSLEVLHFGGRFCQSMEDTQLPQGLQVLDMGGWNDALPALPLPDGLVTLHLGHEFDQPLRGVSFPPGLRELTLGDSFDQPLDEARFPPGLRFLAFGDSFDQLLDGVRWPRDLENLYFGLAMDRMEVVDTDWSGMPSLKMLGVGGECLIFDGAWLGDDAGFRLDDDYCM